MKQQGEMFTFRSGEGEGSRVYSYPLHEVKTLAVQLGMDLEVDKDYLWFLKEALVTILPLGWQKEENTAGLAQYHNTLTGVTTETHPLLYIFRSAYSHLLEMQYNQLKSTASQSDDRVKSPRHRRLEPDMVISLQSAEDQKLFFSELMKKIEKKQEGMKDTAKFEAAMKEVDLFYSSLISGWKVPRSIEDSLEYQCVDPGKMMEVAKMLGIQDDYRLFWVARVFAVLPLPPLWKRSYDTFRNEVYINARYNITLRYHPSKNYFYKLIQTLRFGQLQPVSPIMSFLDKKLHLYEVDLIRLSLNQEYIIRKSEQVALHFRRNSQLFTVRKSALETLDDVMALEIAENAGVDLTSEIHLLGVIFRFFETMKNGLKGWEFRYTVQGEKYWFHPGTQQATKSYPFKNRLKKTINQARMAYYKSLQEVIRDKVEIHPSFQSVKKDPLPKIREESSRMMSIHLGNHLKKKQIEVQEAGAAVQHLPFRPTNSQELMDILYACPFQFECDVDVFEPELNMNSDAEEENGGDVMEKDEVRSLLEDMKKTDVVRLRQKQKLHGLVARPHVVVTGAKEAESSNAAMEEMVSSGRSQMAGKDIRDLVTQRALEAVRNLREAHLPTFTDTDGLSPHPGNTPSPRATQLSSTPSPRSPLPPSFSQHLTTQPGPVRSLTHFPSNSEGLVLEGTSPIQKSLPRRQTTLTALMQEGRLSRAPSSVSSVAGEKQEETQTNSPPFQVAFANSPTFRKTLLRGLQGKSMKSFIGENALNKPGKTPVKVEISVKPESEKSPNLTETAKLESILGSPEGPQVKEISPFTDTGTKSSAVIVEEIPLVTENSEAENPDTLQNTVKALLTPSIFRQEKGVPETNFDSIIQTLAQENQLEDQPTPYKTLLTSIPSVINEHAEFQTSETTSEQLQRILRTRTHTTQVKPIRKINGRTKSNILSANTEFEAFSTTTGPSSQATFSLQTSNSPSKPLSNRLSAVASPVSSRAMSSTEREAVTIDDRAQRRLFPVGNSEDFEAAWTLPRASTVMKSPETRRKDGGNLFIYTKSPQNKPELPRIGSGYVSPTAVSKLHRGKEDPRKRSEDYLNHYVSTLGSPFDVFDLASFPAVAGLHPGDIVKMGQRLGLKVTLQPFESVESDLLWIAYFQLISPLPPRFPIRSIEEIISLPSGAHPGDAYFSLMLDHHRMRRAQELRSMSTLVQVGSMVEQSWLRLRRHTGKCYRYNFLTGEEGFDSALEYVKFKPQVVVHRRTVSLALPGSEVKTGKRRK